MVDFPLPGLSQQKEGDFLYSCSVFAEISHCRFLFFYIFRMFVIRENLLQLSRNHLGMGCFLLFVLLFNNGCVVNHLTVTTVKVVWSFPYEAGTSYYTAYEDV